MGAVRSRPEHAALSLKHDIAAIRRPQWIRIHSTAARQSSSASALPVVNPNVGTRTFDNDVNDPVVDWRYSLHFIKRRFTAKSFCFIGAIQPLNRAQCLRAGAT